MVAKEIEAMTQNVGLMEVSGFNRFSIQGEGATEFLDSITCSNIPKKIGKISLCYLLNDSGNVLAEATLAKLDEEHYWYGSAAAAEWHDLDWLNSHKPDTVTVTEMAASHTILVVAGPKSRDLLQSLSPRCDWSKAGFPWLNVKEMTLGHAKVMAMTVSFSGELAYELHVPNEQLYLVWKLINEAGPAFNLSYFGLYATESMRMEKGYMHWKADLIYERNPMETSLDFFVKMDKPDFVGKKALEAQLEKGNQKQLVTLVIDCELAPAHSGDSIYATEADGTKALIGTVTSGAYGHRVNKNIAFAFVEPEFASIDPVSSETKLSIEILGQHYPAEVSEHCLYDPENALVRS